MTGEEILMLEARRARWDLARSPLKLVDTTTDEFGCGGLAAYAEPPDMRIVVLPADPCQAHVRLNSEAEEWFHRERPRPFDGRTMQWGHERRVTSQALVVGTRFGNDTSWRQYVALHRHGGAEFATADVSWPINDRGVRAFSLVHITAFAWTLLDLQQAVAERWGIEGPWEVTLALRECGGAYLGGLAEGWVSPGEFRYGQPPCFERHALHRWEADALEPEALAMDIADRTENTFGTTHRRHLANRGEYEGRFDPRAAR
jgi:hypothetical protein